MKGQPKSGRVPRLRSTRTPDAGHFSAVLAHDLDRFLNPAAASDEEPVEQGTGLAKQRQQIALPSAALAD